MIDFSGLPLAVNCLILAFTSLVVWVCGVKLQKAVEIISKRMGLGSAFGGLALLAVATSLPELATSISGAVIGNAELLTNNLLGGVAMQTAVLIVVDAFLRRGALTYFAPRYALLLSGVSLISVLGVTLIVLILGDHVAIAGVGLGSTIIFGVYLTLFYLTYSARDSGAWSAQNAHEENQDQDSPPVDEDKPRQTPSLKSQWIIFGIGSLIISVAGWTVMNSAEAIVSQSGLNASFVGATLVAIATSLPELSTCIAAVRRGENEMAISNVFGSNLWDVALLFIGDIFYRQGPLLAESPRQAMFVAALGLVMTCVYLWGLLERKNRTLCGLGLDSVVNLFIYLGGLVVLYRLG